MHVFPPASHHIKAVIKRALKEDLPFGDVTTEALFPSSIPAQATIMAQEPLTLAGLAVARQVFSEIDPMLHLQESFSDGEVVKAHTILLTVQGDARSILKSERVALNLLQHLSGIATFTAQFCQRIQKFPTKILDTRKTIPGLRVLQKWAVCLGGGINHRQSLSDGILIKDNHLAILRSQRVGVDKACELVRNHGSHKLKVCIEAETLDQVKAALKGNPDIILLDNMNPDMVRKAVQLIKARALVEVSGGVHLGNVRQMAAAGADFISVGALTHSVRAMDISLTLTSLPKRARRSRA